MRQPYQPAQEPVWWWMGRRQPKGRPLTREQFWAALSESERETMRELAEAFGPNVIEEAWTNE